MKRIIIALVILITIAHILGFKIIGSATLVKNQPLKNPEKITDITQQGKVVLENDKEYAIYGIITILPKPLEQLRYFKSQIPTLEIEIASPERTTTKVWAKNRLLYYCGNTWMPRPFPPRLRAFSKVDLAEILLREGGAVPVVSIFHDEPEYAKQLMKSFSRAVPDLIVEQNLELVTELGEFLFKSKPEYFREGAWLLAHQGKKDIIDSVESHLQQLTKNYTEGVKLKGGYYSYPGYTIDFTQTLMDFISILEKLSSERTISFLNRLVQSDLGTYVRVRIACRLLSLNSTFGFDILMDEMMESGVDKSVQAGFMHEMDSYLSNSTPGKYYPSEDPQKMYEWYQINKKKLHWDEKKFQMSI